MKEEKNARAKYNWSKIHDAVFGNTSSPEFWEGIFKEPFTIDPSGYHSQKRQEELVLTHGIELIAEYNIEYAKNHVSIKTVHLNKKDNCYLIAFTDGNLCRLNLQNLNRETFHCHQPVYSIAIAEKYQTYVALCRDSAIRILSEKFTLISTIPHSGTCNGLVYNSFTSEIITYGIGKITVWIFRTAGTLLIPRIIISENLQPNDCVSLISIEKTASESQRCFAVVSNGIFVYILSSGECLRHIKDSHNCLITSIMYYKPLQILVTGANDGSIKTWNEFWSLNCLFIGHTAPVTSLAEFPYGPAVMSSSADGTVRTWSLDTKDEMHCEHFEGSVFGIKGQLGDKVFFSYSKHEIRAWKLYSLYSPFSVLGSKPKLLRSTKYPLLQSVSCSVCDDGCVRIICPVSGEIVTVFIAPDYTAIQDVVCIASEALLIVLLVDGRMIKTSYKTNPCTAVKEWTKQTMFVPSQVVCITLFEYHAPKEDLEMEALTKVHRKHKIDQRLLFGGCTDGTIVVFNWKEDEKAGKIVFSLQAHREQVTCMAVNTSLNQLASASQDLTLKVWRIFPFAAEALAPLLMFMHTIAATHLEFSHYSLGVVYQNSSSTLHTFTVYKTKNVKKASELEHDIREDHSDVITCCDTCPKMRLFATGSMDCTVRVWNVDNCLIRVLKLDDVPTSLSFCSQRGDLLLGIGTNINYVSHKRYLPHSYLYQMVAMSFVDCQEISVIPVDRKHRHLSPLDIKRLFKAHSSYIKFMTFLDEVPSEEQERKEEEQLKKEQELSVLEARDKELKLIKEGKLKAKRKHKNNSKRLKDEAFQKYLDLFYTRPNIQYPTDEDSEEKMDLNVDETFAVKIDSSYKPLSITDNTFFAIQASNADIKNIKSNLRREYEQKRLRRAKLLGLDSDLPVVKEKRSLSIATEIVQSEDQVSRPRLPLSASTTYIERLRALQNRCKQDDFGFSSVKLEQLEASAAGEYPLNDYVTRNINKRIISRLEHEELRHEPKQDVLPVAPDGYLPNSVVVALYKELRRESTPKQWKLKELNAKQLAELEIMNRSEIVKSATPTPSQLSLIQESFSEVMLDITPSDEEEFDTVTPPPTPPKPPMLIKMMIEMKKKRSIQKFHSPIPKPVEIPEPVPVAVINIPPVRPPTPLPSFVMQFKDFEWFQKCFPVLNSQALGNPCTLDSFVRLLLKKLEELPEYDIKTHIVSAILLLSQQHPFDKELKDLVRKSLLNELNLPGGKPNSKNSAVELEFIRKTLQALLEIDTLSIMVAVEMMVQYVLGESILRREIMRTFYDLGLLDPKEYFLRELLTKFNIEDPDSPSTKRKVRDLCFKWLFDWSKKFKQHITSLSGKICRTLKTTATKNTADLKDVLNNKVDKTRGKSLISKGITFVSDAFVSGAASHASPIDVINYFCEMKFQEALARLKAEAALKKKDSQENMEKHNTVLFTDKKDGYVSLARIGETHQSKCHPDRETCLHRGDNHQPDTTNNIIRSLMLHAKKVTLAPFPDEIDGLFYAPDTQSSLITLQYAPKYFIQSKSFIL